MKLTQLVGRIARHASGRSTLRTSARAAVAYSRRPLESAERVANESQVALLRRRDGSPRSGARVLKCTRTGVSNVPNNASSAMNRPSSIERRGQVDRAAYTLGVLRWEDERRAAAVLARAFLDDPLVMAICDAPPAERERRMLWSFRIAVRAHCLAGQPAWTVVAPDAQPVGVVLVSRPRTDRQPSPDLLFTLWGLWRIGLRTGLRGLRAGRSIAAHAPQTPFTYLRTLGVAPDFHGRGLGSRLVEQVIRAAPAAWPIYLETAKEQNLGFYARHGFTCVGEFRCLGVPVWRLIRWAPAPGMSSAR